MKIETLLNHNTILNKRLLSSETSSIPIRNEIFLKRPLMMPLACAFKTSDTLGLMSCVEKIFPYYIYNITIIIIL